ncbi:MAG: mechanosensitive ion channel, partial [Bacteroidales bacterium]|nr:mechanosensitive ion channel [Bacteroidales bacterium]
MEKTNITTWESFASGAKQFLNDVVFLYVPKLIMACIVLGVGWKLINLLNKVMKRAYERHQVDPSLQEFLHSLIDIILKVLLVLTAMGILGIQMTSFIAILGAAGVAIGMGLQGTLQNLAGGVIILLL